jgi:catechol 2,3-dioxygenase-like lactoylglutathione lyase family enzyme
MFTAQGGFGSFSVDDLEKARQFYCDTLGLPGAKTEMETLRITLPGGGEAMVYPKDNHEPATFTVLNFVVDDVERAVGQLGEMGLKPESYDNVAGMTTDDKGIMRDRGFEAAWFKDPAGNVFAIMNGGPTDWPASPS